jgi:hypothetical protein
MGLTAVEFESEARAEDHDGATPPLMTGSLVDFADVPGDDGLEPEQRQALLVAELRRRGITERPCMAVALAPLGDLDLLRVDKTTGEAGEEPKAKRPPLLRAADKDGPLGKAPTHIVVPAAQVVDMTHFDPPLGDSVLRCNPAFPAYVWFKAANLLLEHKGKRLRAIPFPLERAAAAAAAAAAEQPDDPLRNIMYHALRVDVQEYGEYQRLLQQAVEADGPHAGFYHASKYAYQVLFNRGFKHISDAEVGQAVTTVILMGRPRMRGVLVLNAALDDWEGMDKTHFVFV